MNLTIKPNHPTLGRVAGSAYSVNLYPNPTAPLIPLNPKSPVGKNRQRPKLTYYPRDGGHVRFDSKATYRDLTKAASTFALGFNKSSPVVGTQHVLLRRREVGGALLRQHAHQRHRLEAPPCLAERPARQPLDFAHRLEIKLGAVRALLQRRGAESVEGGLKRGGWLVGGCLR